jgi:ParB-like nuclease domain
MKLVELAPEDITVSSDLTRTGSAKAFSERLQASIEEIGLAEPIKVAPLPSGGYLVIDGGLRLQAIQALCKEDPRRFKTISAYLYDYEQRFEIRYQSDIYQDLLPSQLAQLVEHLHEAEHVKKLDIARYIGVSPATLRNYTGLARLLQRGGLFAQVVNLMDAEVFPSSNPFAWLRLSAKGIRQVFEVFTGKNESAESWIELSLNHVRRGRTVRYPSNVVESVTGSLPDDCYQSSGEERSVKKGLGLQRTKRMKKKFIDFTPAHKHLKVVSSRSKDPVLQRAAKSLTEYLK